MNIFLLFIRLTILSIYEQKYVIFSVHLKDIL